MFSFLNEPESYSTFLYTIGFFTIPIHIFGAYCILFKTPDTMKHVKWVLFNLHFFNAWLDLTISVLSQPFMIPPIFGGCILGCLVRIGVDLKLQTYLVVTLMSVCAVTTFAIFENRFFILFAENTWWRHGRKIFYIFNITYALVYFIPTILTIPEQDSARKEVFDIHPDLMRFHTPEHPIYVLVNDEEDHKGIYQRQIVNICIFVPTGITLVLLLHWNIWRSTKRMTISENTLRLQKTFLRAVYMQISIPALMIAVPQLILATPQLVRNTPELNNMTYILLSIHGASATLIMLYFHSPYKQFCRKLICGKAKTVVAVGATGTTEA